MISKRTSRAYATHAEEAPGYWMIGVLWRVLATSIQTGNSMCLLDQLCSKGSGPTRHSHPQDEGLYVARGEVTFQAGGVELIAGPGSFVSVPRNTEHSFVVGEEAVLINFYFPAGFDLWLMGSAVPAQRNELPPVDLAPPNLDMLKKLSSDYSGLPMTDERTTCRNPDATAQPNMKSTRNASSYWFDRGCWTLLADGESTGGSYCVFEVAERGGAFHQITVSDCADVAYYVLEGEVEVFVDAETLDLTRGSFAFVPRGSVSTFRVLNTDARFLIIHTAPGFERLVRAAGVAVEEPSLPPQGWQSETLTSLASAQILSDIGLRNIVAPTGPSA